MSKEKGNNELCELCKGRLIKKVVRVIGQAKYDILECEKCKHTLARRVEEII